MAESTTINVTQDEENTLLVPKFIKVSARKRAYKSDLGLMITYRPDHSLKIRIPASRWDDEKLYSAENGGTPLSYIQARLGQKIVQLNDSDDEIKISDFYQVRESNKNALTHLETGVTPVERSSVVYEALDFLMNDPKEGMNCEYHPVFRANVHFNREKFVGDKLTPINFGKFYGFITYTGTCQRPIVQYDWSNIPYNVRARYDSKNRSIDIKRMRGGNSGFFLPIEFKDNFTIISFNQRNDGTFEFNVLTGDRNGGVERKFYEANSKDFVGALEELQCCFFDRFKNEKVREALNNLYNSSEDVFAIGENYCNTDTIYVADGIKEDNEEKFTIGEAVGEGESDEEESEFN